MSDLAWFIPVVTLGAGEEVIALWCPVAGVHGLFQHSNIEPDRKPPAEIGLAQLPDFPQRHAGLMASPFRWASLSRDESRAISR